MKFQSALDCCWFFTSTTSEKFERCFYLDQSSELRAVGSCFVVGHPRLLQSRIIRLEHNGQRLAASLASQQSSRVRRCKDARASVCRLEYIAYVSSTLTWIVNDLNSSVTIRELRTRQTQEEYAVLRGYVLPRLIQISLGSNLGAACPSTKGRPRANIAEATSRRITRTLLWRMIYAQSFCPSFCSSPERGQPTAECPTQETQARVNRQSAGPENVPRKGTSERQVTLDQSNKTGS